MCVALPGKVLAVDHSLATVDFNGNTMKVRAGLVSTKPGDYVLVHAGCILQVLSEYDKNALMELLEDMEDL